MGPEAGKELAAALAINTTVSNIGLHSNSFDAATKSALRTAWGDRSADDMKL